MTWVARVAIAFPNASIFQQRGCVSEDLNESIRKPDETLFSISLSFHGVLTVNELFLMLQILAEKRLPVTYLTVRKRLPIAPTESEASRDSNTLDMLVLHLYE